MRKFELIQDYPSTLKLGDIATLVNEHDDFCRIDRNNTYQESLFKNRVLDFPKFWKEITESKIYFFKTDDGVLIHDGDTFYHVNLHFVIGKGRAIAYSEFRDDYKHFSTKEKAEEYVEQNKPKYSENEVKKIKENIISKHETDKALFGREIKFIFPPVLKRADITCNHEFIAVDLVSGQQTASLGNQISECKFCKFRP